jgi:glycosyltransferase involved in cell wall biosynthesis
MATYKRGAFIAETLDSILPQLREDVELLIVDGDSPDDTEQVVRAYVQRFPQIRYYRETENSGIDGDFDKAVGYARGEHCWLVPDDDLLAPDAVARILEALEGGRIDLLVVDSEVRDVTLTRVLDRRRMPFSGERSYGPADAEAFFLDATDVLSFIGGVIIRRSLWMARERRAYYGTVFIHIGVIFQSPPIERIKMLGEPLVIIRLGNAMWTPRSFEIWMFGWPDLIWGLPGLSDAAKAAVVARRPWASPKRLLLFRASGAFGKEQYRRFFSGRRLGATRLVMLAMLALPGALANLIAVLWFSLRGQAGGLMVYNLLLSDKASWASRAVARLAGGRKNR